MNKYMRPITLFIVSLLFSGFVVAQEHEIALTIDDLPFVGTNNNDMSNLSRSQNRFMKIVQSLVDNQVPATGFVIAGSIGKNQWQLLEEFRKEGFALGNHTYSHANLNRLGASKYIAEIAHADKILAPILTQPKYFRYPYLAEGKGETKQEVQDYLAANQYIVAPVTIDSKDYLFNERLLHINWRQREQHLGQIKQQYLEYIWKQTLKAEKISRDGNAKQILLVHSNLLNSYFLGDIIQMYKNNGYRFISLNEALTNTATPASNETASNQSNKIPIIHQSDTDSNSDSDSEWLTNIEKVW